MKPSEFLKYQGRYRICETCNWDISEVIYVSMNKRQKAVYYRIKNF